MKKIIAISILMFGMNVQAQKKDCKVLVKMQLENVKDTSSIFLRSSKTISAENVVYDGNEIFYSLNLSSDYIFIINNNKVDKICMLKTTDQCDTPLIINVDMLTNSSIAIYWAGDKYDYKYYNDKGF